ncbi:unnamed protein product [Strongylus vulgaris]|uniref:Uncharacterized protein n=1 Tax=Strongylus vulgaris TaxID=40348 RepID=A0A3P7LR97_STRVU|nr:unnamed protein product [Strongylus vulgaris]
MEAMLEEENERRQSLVIVEEPQPEPSIAEEEPEPKERAPRPHRRQSKRVSIVPLHIHVDRRGSATIRHSVSGTIWATFKYTTQRRNHTSCPGE